MAAGMPGTGLGGIFYLLLVALMPLRELARALAGRSTRAGWRAVGIMVALGGSILLALGAEAWLITRALTWLAGRVPAESALGRSAAALNENLVPAAAAAPFLVLGGVLLVGLILRLIFARRPARRAKVGLR